MMIRFGWDLLGIHFNLASNFLLDKIIIAREIKKKQRKREMKKKQQRNRVEEEATEKQR